MLTGVDQAEKSDELLALLSIAGHTPGAGHDRARTPDVSMGICGKGGSEIKKTRINHLFLCRIARTKTNQLFLLASCSLSAVCVCVHACVRVNMHSYMTNKYLLCFI